MPDREEIAEKLKDAAEVLECVRDERSEQSYEYYDGLVKAVDAAIGIVRASKAQEGVKPYRGEEWPNGEYACGCCAQALFDKGKLARPRFCPWCGRKVNWDADGA